MRLAHLRTCVLVTWALTACGGDPSEPAEPQFSGHYELISIDGEAVPLQMEEIDGEVWAILGGAIDVGRADRATRTTFSQWYDADGEPIGSMDSDAELLVIEHLDENRYLLTEESGFPEYPVTLEGIRLHVSTDIGVFVYER